MGTIADIEWRELQLSPKERAKARDNYIRDFDRQFADWSSIAKVCLDVRRDKDYELLGFRTWDAWLIDAAPRSRSYIYWSVKTFEKLSPDIPEEDLAQIPPGSASVLLSVSPAVRSTSKIRRAAREKPAKLRATIKKEFPEQHLESVVPYKTKFKQTAWENIQEAFECYKAFEDEGISLESFLEWLAIDYMDSMSTENPHRSNRQMWKEREHVAVQ